MVRTVGPTAARSDAYEATRKIQLNCYSLGQLISGLQSLARHLPFSGNETGSPLPATDLAQRGGSLLLVRPRSYEQRLQPQASSASRAIQRALRTRDG